MKLRLYLLLALAIASSCSDSGENKKGTKTKYSDLRAESIVGDVQFMKITQFTCDSTGKKAEMMDCCSTLFEYNEDGNLVKQVSTNKEGKVTEEETTTIHENGLRVSSTTMRDGKKTRHMELNVNDSGKYTGGKVLDSANQLQMFYTDLVANDYGQPVSFTLYNKDSSIMMKEIAKYNGNKVLNYVQTDKDGKEIARYENKYNDKGEMTEQVVIEKSENGEQKNITRHTYDEYDEKGNWTKTTRWDDKGKALGVMKREFTYRTVKE